MTTSLKKQQRAKGCQAQQRVVESFRSETGGCPFRDGIPYGTWRPQEPGWEFAPVIVSSNAMRNAINKKQVVRFAAHKGLRWCSWRAPLGGTIAARLSPAHLDHLYTGELVSYFCAGAPAVMTKNVNPTLGISNGTDAVLVDILDEMGSPIPFENGQMLTECPAWLVVRLPGVDATSRAWHGKSLDPDGSCVIAVPFAFEAVKTPYGQLSAKQTCVDLAFSYTYWKAQGRTLRRVVLALDAPPASSRLPSIDLQMLYVGVTRVCSIDDVKIFPVQRADDFRHVKELAIPKAFSAWMRKAKKTLD